MRLIRCFFLLAGLMLTTSGLSAMEAISLIPSSDAKFTRGYFGMHVHNSGNTRNWPTIPIGSIRLWDARVGWSSLEPQKGAWQFDRLDEYIAWAQSHGVDVLLPLGLPPRWASARPDEKGAYGPGSAAEPADMEDWRIYVRKVVQRYHGKIAAYEIWNEANIPNFFSGRTTELVQLIRMASQIIREFDSGVPIVAPSGVGLDHRVAWPNKILDHGAADAVDIASFHLYHGKLSPESIISPVLKMKEMLRAGGFSGVPLWNTEAGYWLPNDKLTWTIDELNNLMPAEKASEFLPRDMLLSRALGFERYYWYAWDNAKMGFIDPSTGQPRPTAAVLSQFLTLFMRSTLERCERDITGLWRCALKGANGSRMQALWTDPAAPQPQIVATPFSGKWTLLDGKTSWHFTTTSLSIGPIVTLITDSP